MDTGRVSLIIASKALSIVSLTAFLSTASAATYNGEPVAIGQGSGNVVVRTDAADKPISIEVRLSHGALLGLPKEASKQNKEGAWLYPLPMPRSGPKTGYSHVVVDWHPHGHPPPKIYTAPHFDFHFYLTSPADVTKIRFSGPNDPAIRVSDARLIPEGYKIIPDTAIDAMGVHAVELAAPEFGGKPFTATFIYGYHNGRLIFIEPMVSHAFLLSRPNFSRPVKVPRHYSFSAAYPTRYSVRYIEKDNAYVIELSGLKYWRK